MTSRGWWRAQSPKEQADRRPDGRDASGAARGVIPCNRKTPATVDDHSASGSLVCKSFRPFRTTVNFESHPTACAGLHSGPLRGSMLPAASSSGFAGGRCPETTRTQLPRKATDKTGGPIFRSPPELLPPAKILLRGPANFPAPGALARTRRDRTRRRPCIVTQLSAAIVRRGCVDDFRQPSAFRLNSDLDFQILGNRCCPGAAAQTRRRFPCPHRDASTEK